MDSDATDNKACASAKLDPFNVKVAKTGDQQCPPGSDCTFKLTLFNPGPINHNAPVTISDKLTGLASAQIVSINPPLPCASQPTQIPFSCTSPGPVRLDLDAAAGSEFGPREFTMVVRLPSDATAEQFSNCASVAGDAGAATAQEACHTVSTKPAEAPGGCAGGMVMTARGCDCPIPTKWNGQACVGAGGINTTPLPKTEPPPVATAPTPAPEPICNGGMILVEGTCACPPFMRLSGGECVGTGGINGTPLEQPEPAPVVVAPVVTPSATVCSAGMVLIEGSCACSQFMRWNGRECVGTGGINGTPQTPPPVVTTPAPRPPKQSGPPAVSGQPARRKLPELLSAKRAVHQWPVPMPSGFEAKRRVCRRIEQAPPRPAPTPAPPKKRDGCPPEAPVGKFPQCCPQNARFTNGQCQCLPGFEVKRRVCRRIEQPRPQPGPQQPPTPRPRPQPGPQQPPAQKTCPDGTKVFGQFTQCPNNKPQLPPKRPLCPPNRPNGVFPNCCPRQMQFRNGQCVDDKCRQGMVGTPPNCACPEGTKFQNDRCRVPETPKCPKGKVGTPPNCKCPSNKEEVKGQCIDKIN